MVREKGLEKKYINKYACNGPGGIKCSCCKPLTKQQVRNARRILKNLLIQEGMKNDKTAK